MLFLDASKVLEHDRSGLCNATSLCSGDDDMGKMTLRKPRIDDKAFQHDVLDVLPLRKETIKLIKSP